MLYKPATSSTCSRALWSYTHTISLHLPLNTSQTHLTLQSNSHGLHHRLDTSHSIPFIDVHPLQCALFAAAAPLPVVLYCAADCPLPSLLSLRPIGSRPNQSVDAILHPSSSNNDSHLFLLSFQNTDLSIPCAIVRANHRCSAHATLVTGYLAS